MGASISVPAANLTMESRALSSFTPHPRIFLHYIDDCFSVVKKTALSAFLLHLNSMEPSIQFMVEEEGHGRLLCKTRWQQTFIWHIQEGHTYWHVPKGQFSPPVTRSQWLLHLFAGQKNSAQTWRIVRLIWLPHVVTSSLQATSVRLYVPLRLAVAVPYVPLCLAHPVPQQPQRQDKRRIPVPYVLGVSESLSRIFWSYDVNVAHVPTRKLRHSLVTVKDKLAKNKFDGVVHRIPCADCGQVYIGETGDFQKRLQQHKYDVNKKHMATNALAEHVASTGHDVSWDSTKIIGKERNKMTRLYLESLHIQTTAQNTQPQLRQSAPDIHPVLTSHRGTYLNHLHSFKIDFIVNKAPAVGSKRLVLFLTIGRRSFFPP